MKMHKEWRQWTQSQRMGFFPIFNKSFLEKLPHITGNAVRLYLFLGAHINNQDGSTTVSIETIMHRFDATKRTVHNWIKELRKHDLILRIQSGFTHPTYTLLLPYHNEFLDERPNMKKLLAEYSDEDLEEDSTEIYDHLNDDPN